MYRLLLVAVMAFGSLTARSQVPASVWARILRFGPHQYDYMFAPQAHLTPAQAASLRRFVQSQYRQHASAFDDGDIGTDCVTVKCLTIKLIHAGGPPLFIVSPYPPNRGEKNPCWWLIRFQGSRIADLTPRRNDFPLPDGYISVEPRTHHAMHDLAALRASGAMHNDITYFTFNGERYRETAYRAFSKCQELPGYTSSDERWCSEDGTPVTSR